MAILKKINFGNGAHNIAKTVVTAKSGGVMTVGRPDGVTNGLDENADYQYELDVNVDGQTLVKSTTTGDNPVTQLAVGTVPAAQVSVAAGGHDSSAAEPDGKPFVATTVEGVLTELNGKIADVGGEAKSYKIVSTTPASNNTLAEYKIQEKIGTGSWGDVTGSDNIIVPKDQHLKSVSLESSKPNPTEGGDPISGQFLKFTYVLNDGSESDVYVDVSAFLTESEFGDGLQVSSAGVVSVKIDSTSEQDGASTPAGFLTVSSAGIKLQGIKDEIAHEIAASEAALAVTAQGDNYVSAAQDANDNKKIVVTTDVQSLTATAGTPGVYNSTTGAQTTAPVAGTLSGTADSLADGADIASKVKTYVDGAIAIEGARSDAKNTADIKAAIEGLDSTDTAVTGQVVTAVSAADGIASPTKADLAGIALGGFTADATASGNISSSDTLGGALNKLSNAIAAAESAASAAHTVVDHANGNTHVTVSASQPDASTGAVTYTVGETNIADADDLADEITRAQNAEGEIATKVGLTGAEGSRAWTPTTNYGGSSASVQANMQALDTQLKTVSDSLAAIQYKVNGTELRFYGMTEHA